MWLLPVSCTMNGPHLLCHNCFVTVRLSAVTGAAEYALDLLDDPDVALPSRSPANVKECT